MNSAGEHASDHSFAVLVPMVRAMVGHGRFRFDVEIGLPPIGRLVRYRVWLSAP